MARRTRPTSRKNLRRLVYDELYPLYRKLYFAFGEPGKGAFAEVLPALIKVAAERNQETVEAKV